MADPSPDLHQALLRLAALGRDAAWLLLDVHGRVLCADGELPFYGLGGLAAGDDATRVLPALVGSLPPPADGCLLPAVATGAGRHVDLALQAYGEHTLVLLLDARTDLDVLDAMQQSTHEADLARLRTAARLHPLQRALTGLGTVILERRPGGALALLTDAPLWLPRLRGTEIRPGAVVTPDELPEFLAHFLVDAEEVWTAPPPGSLRSGPWIERIDDRDHPLEAEARRLVDGTCVLRVSAWDEAYREQSEMLQAARGSLLEYERVRREIQTKDLLLHCIVHDLKGPLATILGGLTLLQRRHVDDERSQRLVELALSQARRQESMIRQVLDVFSAEIASMESVLTDVSQAPDAAALAARVVQQAQPAFQSRGVALRFRHEGARGKPAPVMADADRLERVLGNLLENALRYSPEGSTVILELQRDRDSIRLSVQDQGPGVDPAVAHTIFEKFGRGANGGAAGLGLYFCRYTVESWGGSIGHDPVPQGGARFWVRLLRPRGGTGSAASRSL